MWVVFVLSFALAGSDPADDPPTPTPAVPDLADDDDGGASTRTAPKTPPATPAPARDPADPVDPVDVQPATPPAAPAATPTAPAPPAAPRAPRDPDDDLTPPATTPHRSLPPGESAEPVPRTGQRSPEPRLPIATGGMVALGGCGAGAVSIVFGLVCPYAPLMAPATSCCGAVGVASTMAAQDGGSPITSGAAAGAGIVAGGLLGGVVTAGIAPTLAGTPANCLNDGLCILAMGAVVVAGAGIGATFVGPVLGGGAVAVIEHLRQSEAATPETPPVGAKPTDASSTTSGPAL
jgi:hypothetical protein